MSATRRQGRTTQRDADRAVRANERAHDAVGGRYDDNHPEIFNETEQARLRDAAGRAVALVGSRAGGRIRALDVGSGTGNVVAHLVASGAEVTAADLSAGLLDIVKERFEASGHLEGVLQLNGRDLAPVADRSYDLVTAYSVLHHVPDYLHLVREMARVATSGGIVMIDHERSDASWTSAEYAHFRGEAVVWPRRHWSYLFQPSRYWKRIRSLLEWRRWWNPRWMPEGDLHIWPDDHIEWERVELALVEGGCEIIHREQYLLFEPRYRRDVWERWRQRCADMQMVIARKLGDPQQIPGTPYA